MSSSQISQVRSFNRAVTQRIGALNDDYLQRGRPLGEARFLFEIGASGASGVDMRSLREKLALDPGYASRLLRALEAQGLVTSAPSKTDARVRQIRLTAKGRREYAAYDKSSDAFAEAVLAPLNETQRTKLVAAMREVENLLRAGSVVVTMEDAASADAQFCLMRYFSEIASRFDAGYDPAKGLPAGADLLNPPNGVFLIARLDGAPIGCVGLKQTCKRYSEIKRMWVSPQARGLGLGRRLLDEIEARASALGVKRLRLDTHSSLTEARALYARCGYREIPDFNGEPYADHWFEKEIET